MAHPTPWSPQILEHIGPILREWGLPVHDPFAGEGQRLGVLCDLLGLPFSGTELQEPFIIDPRVKPGDSTLAETYPEGRYALVTSPIYPNGICDHFNAQDDSSRLTYRQGLSEITGFDEPLHENNMGRYGTRSGKKATATYWELARACVPHWPSRVILNTSNHIMDGEEYDTVGRWRYLMQSRGYRVLRSFSIRTPRNGKGANGRKRVEHEWVHVYLWTGTMPHFQGPPDE
jgi:hypothetical protein